MSDGMKASNRYADPDDYGIISKKETRRSSHYVTGINPENQRIVFA